MTTTGAPIAAQPAAISDQLYGLAPVFTPGGIITTPPTAISIDGGGVIVGGAVA